MSTQAGDPTRLRDLGEVPGLRRLLIEHAGRGYRVQSTVRAGLVAYTALTVVLIPPALGIGICLILIAGYVVWAIVAMLAVRGDSMRVLRMSWLAPYGDVAALGALTAVASVSDGRSSTAEALLAGMFVIPLLAALQLRVWAAVSVIAPTVVVFAVCSVLAAQADREDWALAPLRTLVLVCIGVGCILLVRLQASRVLALGRESMRRAALLAELLDTEARERTTLSEHLHDGALQYVLAARQELAELPGDTDVVVAERLQTALGEASTLLRSQVAELSPAVLQQAGLVAAVQRLAQDQAARGRFSVEVDASGWTGVVDAAVERLLFDSAREFLRNVATHADATRVTVELVCAGATASVAVHDDGVGIAPDALAAQLVAGHIGLATRRIRLEAAGGRLEVAPNQPRGLTARAMVPVAV